MTTILILGGTGLTGKLLARHLLEQSDAIITIASRKLEKAKALADALGRDRPGRINAVQAEAGDAASLRAALPGHDLVLVASPTTAHAETVARAALAAGVDYLDIQLSDKKLQVLQSLAPEIERAGRCFITEAGFHPGLPAALVRFAAAHLDEIESALVACYLSFPRDLPYTDAADELVDVLQHYQAQIFTNGAWTKPDAWQMRRIDFGGDLGSRDCYSMFFEELRAMPQLFPTLRETGFFMAGTHWFVDWFLFPLSFVLLKYLPFTRKPVGKLLWWGMTRCRKPPFRTELVVKGSGVHAGQPTAFDAAVSHADAYELTAIPVVAALLQYIDGSARKPGLWMMGQLVEPTRLFTDMKRMGVKLRNATA